MTAKDEKETRADRKRRRRRPSREEEKTKKKVVDEGKQRGTEGGTRSHRGRSQYTPRCVIADSRRRPR